MNQRLAALLALAGFALAILLFLVWRPGAGAGVPDRVSFQIATGGGNAVSFTVGQAVAGLISHPPGVGRCETSTVCGPAGVILSTRTSPGGFDNVTAVNDGKVDSAFVQGDILARAAAGEGPSHRGAQKHVRVLAALFSEKMHLVVAAGSGIADVAALRGKRVALGEGGTEVTAREILSAWRLPLSTLKRSNSGNPAADLAAGRIDAFFVMSGVPVDAVSQLLATGKARLAPIAGAPLARLSRETPQLSPAVIAAGAYPGSGAVQTVATRAFWIVRDRANNALVYGLTRALFNPANHDALAASHPAAAQIDAAAAAIDPPAPLQAGAARYYREAGAPP